MRPYARIGLRDTCAHRSCRSSLLPALEARGQRDARLHERGRARS